MKSSVSSLLFLLFFTVHSEPCVLYTVKIPKKDHTLLFNSRFDVLGARVISKTHNEYDVLSDPQDIKWLREQSTVTTQCKKRVLQSRSLKRDQSGENYYMNYDETMWFLDLLEQRFQEVTKVYTIGSSIEGRNINALKISTDPDNNNINKHEVVFLGVHHAREWISLEVVLHLARFILMNYENNERIGSMVEHMELWFVPVVNPDGYVYSHSDNRFWRMNRRKISIDVYGVDNNRNYDGNWIENEHFHGTEPFSEPENVAVRNLLGDLNFAPIDGLTDNVTGVLTYHSYGQLILYPPGSTDQPAANASLMQAVGERMAEIIEDLSGNIYQTRQLYELYPVFGDTTEWFHMHHDKNICFTIELPPFESGEFDFDLPPEYIEETLYENIAPALYFVEYLMSGNIYQDTDENNNQVIDYYEDASWEYPEGYYMADDEQYEQVQDIDVELNDGDQERGEKEISSIGCSLII